MNKRFVSIWFPYLSTDWVSRNKPTLRSIPFVLTSMSHGRMIVTSANEVAQQQGVYTGMPLADARAICPMLEKMNDQEGLVNKILNRIAEWCIRFSPVTAVDAYGGVIIDATGCAHLWGGEEAYVLHIIKRLEQKGLSAKAAIADTIGAAWAVTRFSSHITVVAKGKQIEALFSLPPAALRIDTETIQVLHKLGMHYIKDLLSLKATSLRRRFGDIIISRIRQATGAEQEFIQPIIPEEPYTERLHCLEPIFHAEGIEIALQKLLEAMVKRLANEGKGVRTAELMCYKMDGNVVSIQISTSAASCNILHLFNLFKLKIDMLHVEPGIELFVLNTRKAEDYIPAQVAIWKEKGGLCDYRLSELVDRLAGKAGVESIHRYLPAEHYWPERSYTTTTSLQEKPTTSWRVDRPRPIRLLPNPQQIEVTAPIPDYPPMLFRYKGSLHKIVKADGPERIEQEWWIKEGEHRDYYTVEDEKGNRYWLFRSGHYDAERKYGWYLHGFFA